MGNSSADRGEGSFGLPERCFMDNRAALKNGENCLTQERKLIIWNIYTCASCRLILKLLFLRAEIQLSASEVVCGNEPPEAVFVLNA